MMSGIARLFLWVVLGGLLAACKEADDTGASAREPVSTRPSRVAITVDDLPYVTFGGATPEDGLGYARKVTAALEAHGVVATGFVIGGNVDARTRPALEVFAQAGHTIGNHSWSHPDYGDITPEAFRRETEQTDEALKDWMTGAKYYRFPYLRRGESAAKRAAAQGILAELGYRNVPVSIDNDEWRFNAEYTKALKAGEREAAARIAQEYLAHMQERTAYFQRLAMEALGGDVDHTLLIHLNRINADHLGALLAWYEEQGWSFITVEEALADPVYARAELYEGHRGLSQIERVVGGPRE